MPHCVEMITVAGAQIRLFHGGAGEPLVFLHGAGGHAGWMAFLEELSARFEVFAPEHPGFGQSDDPPWLDEIGDLAYFHLDLLHALGLERVHLDGDLARRLGRGRDGGALDGAPQEPDPGRRCRHSGERRADPLDVPTLLLWGERDGLVPPAFGEAYHELIPGARLVVLPDAGHAPFDEQRDAFLAAFYHFIGSQ